MVKRKIDRLEIASGEAAEESSLGPTPFEILHLEGNVFRRVTEESTQDRCDILGSLDARGFRP